MYAGALENEEFDGNKICAEWVQDNKVKMYSGLVYSVLVSVINSVFKKIAFHLVQSLKLKTISSEA